MRTSSRRRDGFSLIEVMIAGVVFFLILMVFQMIFQLSTRGEGRDLRRTQALVAGAELLEQVIAVHRNLGDLPVVDRIVDLEVPASRVLASVPGGQLQVTKDVPGFSRRLVIEVLHEGPSDVLLSADRAYLVRVVVSYPGPIGEPREEVVSTVRSRLKYYKANRESPPWD